MLDGRGELDFNDVTGAVYSGVWPERRSERTWKWYLSRRSILIPSERFILWQSCSLPLCSLCACLARYQVFRCAFLPGSSVTLSTSSPAQSLLLCASYSLFAPSLRALRLCHPTHFALSVRTLLQEKSWALLS